MQYPYPAMSLFVLLCLFGLTCAWHPEEFPSHRLRCCRPWVHVEDVWSPWLIFLHEYWKKIRTVALQDWSQRLAIPLRWDSLLVRQMIRIQLLPVRLVFGGPHGTMGLENSHIRNLWSRLYWVTHVVLPLQDRGFPIVPVCRSSCRLRMTTLR